MFLCLFHRVALLPRNWKAAMEKRDFKTHPSQWKVIIDYFEEHPVLIKHRFEGVAEDNFRVKKLWEELVNHLNSMGFGYKTKEKWQMAIGRWKSKVKAKASALRRESEKTGGGPLKAVPLNETEQRLMKIVGWKAITGDQNVELGLPIIPTSEALPSPVITSINRVASPIPGPSRVVASPIPGPSRVVASPIPGPSRVVASPIPGPSRVVSPEGNPPRVSPPPLVPIETIKKRKRTPTTSERSRKFVSLNKMHTETLQVLKSIENNTKRLANAHERLCNDIHLYVQSSLKKTEMDSDSE